MTEAIKRAEKSRTLGPTCLNLSFDGPESGRMDVGEWIRLRVYCIVASKLVLCICDEWMDDDFDGHRGFQNLGNMARKSKVKMF
jgi:hypothetical protein